MTKSGQLILDVNPITNDEGTDNTEATFTDPIGNFIKAFVTCYSVTQGRGHVQAQFSANPIIDFRTDFVQKWSIDL